MENTNTTATHARLLYFYLVNFGDKGPKVCVILQMVAKSDTKPQNDKIFHCE